MKGHKWTVFCRNVSVTPSLEALPRNPRRTSTWCIKHCPIGTSHGDSNEKKGLGIGLVERTFLGEPPPYLYIYIYISWSKQWFPVDFPNQSNALGHASASKTTGLRSVGRSSRWRSTWAVAELRDLKGGWSWLVSTPLKNSQLGWWNSQYIYIYI